MKRPELKFVAILLLALTLFTVPASAGSAERTFSSSVSPDQEFKVTVNIADYGAAGQVIEKLPAGFTFVSSTLPERAVTVNGSEVSFLLMTEKSFSYTLKAPATTGTYKIAGILRDINKTEFSVRPADCSITVSQSSGGNSGGNSGGSSGGSSGGGGGGGGVSAEPQSNVAAKELSKKSVNSGERVKFEFPQGATCIRYVEFDAKKSLGKVTTIVEMLKEQSKLVSGLPEGTVYKNVNIWVGSGGIANSNNIANAVVGFRIEKDWLKNCGADNTSVALWNYNNKAWSKLETTKVGGDNTYVFFESKTPGFGPFTIVVPSESKELKSSSSADTSSPTTESSKSSPAADAEKPSEKSSIPGFESTVAVGILGAVYQILRRK